MQAKLTYKSLEDTLQYLKKQVIDSLPYVANYIPSDIATPYQLFNFLKQNVVYKKDPIGVELLQTVQTLMENGGHGDCDCFTILTLTSCYYLNFEPQQVALVGKNNITPTHIYSLVYDPGRGKMCSMDLTNPAYDMQRKTYKYKQTLDFMILQLADSFPLLSSRDSRREKKEVRKEKKSAKTQKKKVRKVGKQQVKIKRAASKQNKKNQRSIRRDNKANAKTLRKATTQATRQERRNKGMMKVKGRQAIVAARQQGMLNKKNKKYEKFLPSDAENDQDNIDATMDPTFSPESDESDLPMSPAGGYQASDADQDEYSDYQDVTDETDSDMNSQEGLSAGAILSVIKGAGKGVIDQFKGQAKQAIGLNADQVKALQAENLALQQQVNSGKNNVLIFSGIAAATGIGLGYFIGRK